MKGNSVQKINIVITVYGRAASIHVPNAHFSLYLSTVYLNLFKIS